MKFLNCRNLAYSKLYDSTNKVYLCVNENGRLESKSLNDGRLLGDDGMYWTRSFGSIIENKATGKLDELLYLALGSAIHLK